MSTYTYPTSTYPGAIVTVGTELLTYVRTLQDQPRTKQKSEADARLVYFNDLYQVFLREFVRLTDGQTVTASQSKRLHGLLDELVKLRS